MLKFRTFRIKLQIAPNASAAETDRKFASQPIKMTAQATLDEIYARVHFSPCVIGC